MDFIFNLIGISGVLLIFTAYLLGQRANDFARTPLFSAMNLVGALLVIASLSRYWNLSQFVLEVVWVGISAYGLIAALRRKKEGKL